MGIHTGNTNKKASTADKNTETEEKRDNMSGRKEQSNATKTNDTTRGDKLESADERRKTKKISR